MSQAYDGKNQANVRNGKCQKRVTNTKANNSYILSLIGQTRKFGNTYELIMFRTVNCMIKALHGLVA